MSKIDRDAIVVYNSQTGFTAKYALWIAEKLECPFIKESEASAPALQHYKTVIFGGWIKAGQIQGLTFLKKNIESLPEQKIILFCNGSAPTEEQDLKKLAGDNLTGKLEGLPLFYFPGGLDMNKMSGANRLAMKAFLFMLKKSGKKEVAEKLAGGVDLTKPEYVDPLVAMAKAE